MIITVFTNNDTLPFESGEYAQRWCEGILVKKDEEEVNGVLTDGRNLT